MKRIAHASAAALITVLIVGFSAAPSYADGPGDDPGKAAIQKASEAGVVQGTVNAPKVVKPTGPTTQVTVPAVGATNVLHDTASKAAHPAGGSSSTVTTGFTTNVVWANANTQATLSGNSYARWLGATPLNANKVALTDHFWNAALGVTSVNISSSPGIGLTVTSGSITYSNTIKNSWNNNHSYSGWRFTGALFSVSETSQGAITIGSTTWIVNTP